MTFRHVTLRSGADLCSMQAFPMHEVTWVPALFLSPAFCNAVQLLASKTAHYVICVRQDDLFRESGKRGGASFLAKLRASSTDPTEYALYDR